MQQHAFVLWHGFPACLLSTSLRNIFPAIVPKSNHHSHCKISRTDAEKLCIQCIFRNNRGGIRVSKGCNILYPFCLIRDIPE